MAGRTVSFGALVEDFGESQGMGNRVTLRAGWDEDTGKLELWVMTQVKQECTMVFIWMVHWEKVGYHFYLEPHLELLGGWGGSGPVLQGDHRD